MEKTGITKKDLIPTAKRVLLLDGQKLDSQAEALMKQMPTFVIAEIDNAADQLAAIGAINTLYKFTNGSYNPSMPEIRKAIELGVGSGPEEVVRYAQNIRKAGRKY